MIKITVLGSGASIPSVNRNLPGLAIKYGKVYLFDCGDGSQRQMMKYAVGYGSVKAIFITHMHLDHYLGIFGLLSTLKLMGRTEQLTIFAPAGIERLNLDFGFVKVVSVKAEGELYAEKDFAVTAFRTKHSTTSFGYCFRLADKWRFNEKKAKGQGIQGPMFSKIQQDGFIIVGKKKIKLEDVASKVDGKKVIYTGDTAPCESTIKAAAGADFLFHDSSFSQEQEPEALQTLHSTIGQAAQVAKKAKALCLVAMHISPRYDDTAILLAQAKKIMPKTEIAYDGMEILLKP